jgi:hypothetical protein
MAEGYQGYQSLSHSKWDCKYHVVFIPPKRRKALFGSTAFEAAPLIKPPALRGVSDFLFQKFEEIL